MESQIRLYGPRPVEIEAIQFTGTNEGDVREFLGAYPLNIAVLSPGDYVMRTASGTFGICDAFEFSSLYEDLGPVA